MTQYIARGNTSISVRRESDVMSIAFFLKDAIFSKVNVKVLGDIVDIVCGTKSTSLFRRSY